MANDDKNNSTTDAQEKKSALHDKAIVTVLQVNQVLNEAMALVDCLQSMEQVLVDLEDAARALELEHRIADAEPQKPFSPSGTIHILAAAPWLAGCCL